MCDKPKQFCKNPNVLPYILERKRNKDSLFWKDKWKEMCAPIFTSLLLYQQCILEEKAFIAQMGLPKDGV